MSEISTTPIDDGGAIDNRQPSNRAEINRANARHSTGPRTEAGKKRSSLNALRHGITGQTIVLPPGDLAAYERHCKELHDQFRPANKLEVLLTQTLADLSWRLNRISAVETNLLTMGINENSNSVDAENDQVRAAVAMAKTVREQNQLLANITLYEHRLSGRFDKALKQLRELQAERLARESSDMHDAARILQMHKNKKVPYNPMDDGFVFSNADIETYIQRRNRKNQTYAATG